MSEMKKKAERIEKDVKTQYCKDDCLHDCIQPGKNNCNAVTTGHF